MWIVASTKVSALVSRPYNNIYIKLMASYEVDDQLTPRYIKRLSANFRTNSDLRLPFLTFLPSPSLTQRVIDGVEGSIKRLNLRSGLEYLCDVPGPYRGVSQRGAFRCRYRGPLTLSNCEPRAPRARDLCIVPEDHGNGPSFHSSPLQTFKR